MNVDETEPISVQNPDEPRRKLDPWKILAGVSTAVSVAAIATLVWTVNKISEEPTPSERLSAAAGVTSTVFAPPPAPEPVAVTETIEPMAPSSQPEPIAQTTNSADWNSPLNRYFPMAAPAPVRNEGAPPPPPGMPVWPFAANAPLPNVSLTPNIVLPPGTLSIDAIIGAVTGTAGWIGGGTLDLIGDVLVASAANGGGPLSQLPPPQWPRELDVTKIPPPQWPRELDVTKIPPPQWPRELDVTKIPPPHVHWDRILPRF